MEDHPQCSSKTRAASLHVAFLFYDPQALVNCGRTNQCILQKEKKKKKSIFTLKERIIGPVGTDQRVVGKLPLSGQYGGAKTCEPHKCQGSFASDFFRVSSDLYLDLQLRIQYRLTLPTSIAPHLPLTLPSFFPKEQGTHLLRSIALFFFSRFLTAPPPPTPTLSFWRKGES